MGKPGFGICENKDADQLRYTDSTISLLPKYEISSLQPSSVAVQPGVWGLVGNPEDRFSQNEAHIIISVTVQPSEAAIANVTTPAPI